MPSLHLASRRPAHPGCACGCTPAVGRHSPVPTSAPSASANRPGARCQPVLFFYNLKPFQQVKTVVQVQEKASLLRLAIVARDTRNHFETHRMISCCT